MLELATLQYQKFFLMEKIPHTSYVSILLNMKFGGFGIGYGIGRKYRPKVSANWGFGFGNRLTKIVVLVIY